VNPGTAAVLRDAAPSQLIADGDRAEQGLEILDPDLDETFAEPVGRQPPTVRRLLRFLAGDGAADR